MARNHPDQRLPFIGNQAHYFDQAAAGRGTMLAAPRGHVFALEAAVPTDDYRLYNEQLGATNHMVGVPRDTWHPPFMTKAIVGLGAYRLPDNKGQEQAYLPLFTARHGTIMLGRAAFQEMVLRPLRPDEDVKSIQQKGTAYLHENDYIEYLPRKYAAAILRMNSRR